MKSDTDSGVEISEAPINEDNLQPKKDDPKTQSVLMVEVENVVHEKFNQTEEVKVIFYVFEKK